MYHDWQDRDPFTGELDWKLGIRNMVSYGVNKIYTTEYTGLKFSVFNKEERDYVYELMETKTYIPFTVNYIDFAKESVYSELT